MRREIFAKVVRDSIWGYLPKDIRESGEIKIYNKKRDNEIDFYGLTIERKTKELVPVLDLEPYYNEYERAHNIEKIVMDIAKEYEKILNEVPIKAAIDFSYENIKDKISFRVVNMKLNRDRLEEVIYTPIATNLAMTYHMNINESLSIPITKEISNAMGYKEEHLFNDSKSNAEKLNPAFFRSLRNVKNGEFRDTNFEDGIFVEDIDYKTEETFVLSNKSGIFGAAVLFNPNILDNIGKIIDDDFYAIPSSVHEFIIVSEKANISPAELTLILRDTNLSVVDKEDILYDKVLKYDRENKDLSIVNIGRERGR